ncbi:hypothetical protein QD357_29780 [Rhizobium sp. BR 317]|uniref:hypothetical protein n=1 Tax=Rhizobium sp. BR 317 TaxID=3040015 RepID=UPI0039BF8848
MRHPLNEGIFQPGEVAALRDIYRYVSRQPWFAADREMKKQFAAFIIRMYRHGEVDIDNLRKLSIMAASRHLVNRRSSFNINRVK